jgi:hypothetical protein
LRERPSDASPGCPRRHRGDRLPGAHRLRQRGDRLWHLDEGHPHHTFNGSDTTPNGTDIDVRVGQRIELDVTADKPGEIHVHSSPKEQEFEYGKGSSTFDLTPIPAPGQVVVESHTLNKTLFTLVAR